MFKLVSKPLRLSCHDPNKSAPVSSFGCLSTQLKIFFTSLARVTTIKCLPSLVVIVHVQIFLILWLSRDIFAQFVTLLRYKNKKCMTGSLKQIHKANIQIIWYKITAAKILSFSKGAFHLLEISDQTNQFVNGMYQFEGIPVLLGSISAAPSVIEPKAFEFLQNSSYHFRRDYFEDFVVPSLPNDAFDTNWPFGSVNSGE